MKKNLLVVFIVAVSVFLITSFAFADEVAVSHNKAGAIVDAPNLIRFTENLTLGIEGGKEMAYDLFYKSGDGVIWEEADRGYFGYVKITWTRTLFDFSKKKKSDD